MDISLHQQAVAAYANAGGRNGSALSSVCVDRPAGPVAARSGAERVLDLARKRGRHGVHHTDFDPGRVVDGGRAIRRLAARIDELKGQGHWFTTRRNRDRTITYILVRDAATVEFGLREVAEPERPFEPPRLFEPETQRGDFRDSDAA
jgi:hypothetical protein